MVVIQNIHEIKDLKYFGWEIYPPKKNKKQVNWDDFMKRVKLDAKPRHIIDIKELNKKLSSEDETKLVFKDKRPSRFEKITFWEYPVTVPPSIACYVASKRGCSMSEVNFLVHGSVLGILSRAKPKAKNEHIMVQRLGGKNIINIRNVIDSSGNLVDAGHQFEKLVTGENINSKPSLRQNMHLRLMQVGSFQILVCAESDAIDANDKQIEVKSKNLLSEKAYDKDKLKFLFQMISNGSEHLIAPERIVNEDKSFCVEEVKKIPIQELVDSLSEGKQYLNRKTDTVQSNLQIIQERIPLGDDKCYELTFEQDEIHLNPFLKEDEKNSKCKTTQYDFQNLNSSYYREHLLQIHEPDIKKEEKLGSTISPLAANNSSDVSKSPYQPNLALDQGSNMNQ